MDLRPIGVFDSGVGGVSLLRHLRAELPGETFLYYNDCLNAPYGTRQEAEIRALADRVVDFLLAKDIKALVIACNTATSAAAAELRERLTIPVFGIEPALKPASEMLREGERALVMATPATLRQKKFADLYAKYGAGAEVLPCPGLMEFVERGELGGEELERYLTDLFENVPDRDKIRVVVLGCTHYSFLKDAIAKYFPQAALIDGNDGTARQVRRVLTEKSLLSDAEEGKCVFFRSGDSDEKIRFMAELLKKNEEKPIS